MRLVHVWALIVGHLYWVFLTIYHSWLLRPLRRLLRPKGIPLEVRIVFVTTHAQTTPNGKPVSPYWALACLTISSCTGGRTQTPNEETNWQSTPKKRVLSACLSQCCMSTIPSLFSTIQTGLVCSHPILAAQRCNQGDPESLDWRGCRG
jgi:hypothetical protein